MSWMPPNLTEICPTYSEVSTCQLPVIMFMNFLVDLFGFSNDGIFETVKPKIKVPFHTTFSR